MSDAMLIDTNALIWYALAPRQLTKRAAGVIRERRNFYSHVSLWEMAIKSSAGKLELRGEGGRPSSAKQFMLRLIRDLGLRPLVLEFDDLAGVEALPWHHRDPFDRLLVVQAQRRKLEIVSSDAVFEKYGVARVW
jgi:PIN domain nuclease of toxin-antitoxin system